MTIAQLYTAEIEKLDQQTARYAAMAAQILDSDQVQNIVRLQGLPPEDEFTLQNSMGIAPDKKALADLVTKCRAMNQAARDLRAEIQRLQADTANVAVYHIWIAAAIQNP